MRKSIFIFTAGESAARAHLANSIDKPISLDFIREDLSPAEKDEIDRLAIGGELYAWGAVPGQKNIPLWETLTRGDIALCVFDSYYQYVSEVTLKIHNPKVAQKVWGSLPDGTTWEYMYFLSKPRKIKVSLERLADLLNARYMGFTRISDERISHIQAKYGSLETFVQKEFIQVIEDHTKSHRFELVTREDVLDAINEIERNGPGDFGPSTKYDLMHNSNRYPAKAAMGIATRRTLGRPMRPDEFSGGEESKCFRKLRDLGFEIVEKEFNAAPSYFVIRSNQDSPWADRTGISYHYSNSVPNCKNLATGGMVIVDRRLANGKYVILGWGILSPAESTVSGGAVEYVSMFEEWHEFQPPKALEESDRALIASTPRFNAQHSIRKIDRDVFEALLGISREAGQEVYTVEQACEDLFVAPGEVIEMLGLLESKKNLILQGAPGTGKSHLAKRLAMALIGEKATDRIQMIQFHQAYSYEDFLGGFKPTRVGDSSGFEYSKGVFSRFCDLAKANLGKKYVFIIDEINRGNLSKILGEAMLLIECDKRGPDWTTPLSYSAGDQAFFYVPENLYILGLMNTADRSLAMVDYALRRRFAFKTLEPAFRSPHFKTHLQSQGISSEVIKTIEDGMSTINQQILEDKDLGRGFLIGHSFFSQPPFGMEDGGVAWVKSEVEAEIKPLLQEYWFEKSEDEIETRVAPMRP